MERDKWLEEAFTDPRPAGLLLSQAEGGGVWPPKTYPRLIWQVVPRGSGSALTRGILQITTTTKETGSNMGFFFDWGGRTNTGLG